MDTQITDQRILDLLPYMEKLFNKTSHRGFGVFGTISVKCDSDTIISKTEIPKSTEFFQEIGDVESGRYRKVFFEITFNIRPFDKPVVISIAKDNIQGPKILITTSFYNQWGDEKKGFTSNDVNNHPFILSWRAFISEKKFSVYLKGMLDTTVSVEMDEGQRLVNQWFEWLEIYS